MKEKIHFSSLYAYFIHIDWIHSLCMQNKFYCILYLWHRCINISSVPSSGGSWGGERGQEGAVAPFMRLISSYPEVKLPCPSPPFAPMLSRKSKKIVIFVLNEPTNIYFAPSVYQFWIRHWKEGTVKHGRLYESCMRDNELSCPSSSKRLYVEKDYIYIKI